SHTATLIGDSIYIVGSLGYQGARHYGTTPVRRLDIYTMRIETLDVLGEPPGWIYRHRAVLLNDDQIVIHGGTIVTAGEPREVHTENEQSFILDVRRLMWLAAG